MKIKSIAAVGAMGVGLGLASLLGGTGVASAGCSNSTQGDPPVPNPGYTPPLTPARVLCVTNEQLAEFQRTTSPQYNLDVLVNGTADDPGLGLVNQPGTFVNSLVGEGGFFDGPRSPDPAPESANGF
jgi:hypothetical protein